MLKTLDTIIDKLLDFIGVIVGFIIAIALWLFIVSMILKFLISVFI